MHQELNLCSDSLLMSCVVAETKMCRVSGQRVAFYSDARDVGLQQSAAGKQLFGWRLELTLYFWFLNCVITNASVLYFVDSESERRFKHNRSRSDDL